MLCRSLPYRMPRPTYSQVGAQLDGAAMAATPTGARLGGAAAPASAGLRLGCPLRP